MSNDAGMIHFTAAQPLWTILIRRSYNSEAVRLACVRRVER